MYPSPHNDAAADAATEEIDDTGAAEEFNALDAETEELPSTPPPGVAKPCMS